jgi:hypothetical protein
MASIILKRITLLPTRTPAGISGERVKDFTSEKVAKLFEGRNKIPDKCRCKRAILRLR